MKQQIIKFNENTELVVGDYFRTYKSKYFTLIKDIYYNQRNFEDEYGEYKTTLLKIDIFDKKENLLASNSIVPINKLISGALSKYIPDLNYDPTYLGSIDPYKYPVQYKIWKDMTNRCFDCTNSLFPYIGALGTTVCDRWRCFEYFFADLIHMDGYTEAGDTILYQHYIVDLYDIQKNIHPSKRIYAPGYVKLKPFKQSDICKYGNISPTVNNYPKDLETTMKYKTGEIDIKESIFNKQTGLNIKLDLNDILYYYDHKIGYQPLVGRTFNPYTKFYIAYNYYYNTHINNKEMCTIIRKDDTIV